MNQSEPRTVVVTGGTRGIGAAIARAFADEKAELIITGTSSIAPQGCTARYHALELTDPASVAQFCEFLAALPVVDVLINNAGINVIKPLEEMTTEDFARVGLVNTTGPFALARAVAPRMKQRRSGHIINIASIWSVATKPRRSAYSAAKAGLAGLTRALAAELGPDGILVNTVSPGFTLTDLTAQSLGPEEIRAIGAQIPLGRMASPDEIASVVSFLASPKNTYITGQNIVADGGFTIV